MKTKPKSRKILHYKDAILYRIKFHNRRLEVYKINEDNSIMIVAKNLRKDYETPGATGGFFEERGLMKSTIRIRKETAIELLVVLLDLYQDELINKQQEHERNN